MKSSVAKGNGAMKKEPRARSLLSPGGEKSMGNTRGLSKAGLNFNATGKARHKINGSHKHNTMPDGYKSSCS
jgi:hypothetical protein